MPLAAAALLVLAVAGIAPVHSAVAVFTKQASVPANTVTAAASFPVCYRDAVLADNPVGYWRLDETTGTIAADSRGTNPGTYVNAPMLGQPGALPGAIDNRAPAFDGYDDDVDVNDAAALRPAQISVEAWLNPQPGIPQWASPVMKTSNDNWGDGFGFYYDSSGTIRFFVNNYSAFFVGAPIEVGRWTHVVGTYDGVNLILYENGIQVASMAYSTPISHATTPLHIGAGQTNGSAGYYWPGGVDEVALYSSALSPAQIRTHYNTGRCYKDAVLADNAAGYWRLGETSGTTAAEGVYGRHGSYANTPTLAATGALNGDANKAITLNGTSQYVSVPYGSALNPAQITLEGWAKPTGGTGTARTVAATQDTNKGYLLGIGTDNKWRFTVGTGSAVNVAVSSATVILNSWAHVVGTYDGTTAKLYVNGIQAGSVATTASANTTRPLGIGATDAGGSWAGYFAGSLDEVALYPSALSQSRVQAHYLIGRSHRDALLDRSPVSYWRLGESSGTTATDQKAANAGTYMNGAALAQVGAIAGDADTSAGFDGVDDYVAVPYAAALNPAQFTLEAWTKVTGGSGTWRLVASSWTHPSDYQGYWVGVDDQDRWSAHMGDGVVPEVKADGPTVTLDSWTHLAETYDGATLRLYVNGALAASFATTTYTQNTSPTAFEIGAEYFNGAQASYFPGSIDEVALYNRALTSAEIQLHYDSGRQ